MTSKIGLIPLPFAGGFYRSRSRQFSQQRCVNWYPSIPDGGALNDVQLIHCSGLREVADTESGINRGAWVMNKKPYFVNGNSLYRLDRVVNQDLSISYTDILIGTITGSERVQMASNKLQLAIVVPGVEAYIYTEGGALTAITDPDFDGPVDDVVALDSVFVFNKTDSNIIFHSNLNDGLDYLGLDSFPVPQLDEVVGLGVYANQLYVFGDNKTIPFSNIGGSEFLFAPIPNAAIDKGLRTKYLKTKFGSALVWVGSGENEEISVCTYSGGNVGNISNEPIDFLLQNMSDEEIERAFMIRHSQSGADFMVLNIGDYCLKYDAAASARAGDPVWHEQRSRIPVGADHIDSVWRVNSIVQAYNRVFVGDSVDGRIGEMADDIGTEYGIKMRCYFVTQPLSNMGVKGKVWAVEVFTDVGVSGGQVINMSWTDDAYTWSNSLERGLGEIGEYGRRVVFDRLGAFSIARSLMIEYSGDYPISINKLMANAQ